MKRTVRFRSSKFSMLPGLTIMLCLMLSPISLSAQAPQSFQYQTIIRDAQGEVVMNQNVSLRMTIIQGAGTEVYQETHDLSTNAFGLVNLEIGTGMDQSGTFNKIPWSTGEYHLQVELDLSGIGNSYTLMGTTQLLSVPYSFYADTSNVAFNGIEDLSFSDGALTLTTVDGASRMITILNSYQRFLLGETLSDLLGSGVTLQDLLTDGATPCELLDAGAIETDLYGLTYEGGLIFYIDNSGPDCTGLVAAPADSDLSGDFTHQWGCLGTDITGAPNVGLPPPPSGLGAEIGDGATNTTAILTDGSGCITEDDAAFVASLPQGSYNDWFLPSAGELNLMWENLADSDGDDISAGPSDPNNLGGFEQEVYWSSTEYNSNLAWFQNFVNGIQDVGNKLNFFRVRAVRAF